MHKIEFYAVTFLDRSSMRLTDEKRAAVIRCLVEGCSIRSTVRIAGVSKNTIKNLTIDLGEACLQYRDQVLRNLPSKRLELDEIWSFCYVNDKNLPDRMKGAQGVGSMWTWTRIDAESKLIWSCQLGAREAANAHAFITDLSERQNLNIRTAALPALPTLQQEG